jgi:chemotaxis protein MotA
MIQIVGSAFGAFLTSNPLKVVRDAFSRAVALVKGPTYSRDDDVTLLKLLYDILVKMRKDGVMAI